MNTTPQSADTTTTTPTLTTTTPTLSGTLAGGPGPVVVIGATGKTGRRVVDRLAAAGVRTRAVSRSSGTPFLWEDEGTWDAALEGTSAAYISYYPDLAAPGALEVVSRLAKRARGHGIERAVLLSGRGEPEAQAAERAVLAELPKASVVSCAWFMQNFSEGLLRDAVLAGGFGLPAPGSAVEPFVDLDDVADVAVQALTGTGHEGRVLGLTGPSTLSLDETAAALSEAIGRPVGYTPLTVPGFADVLVGLGMPLEEALPVSELFEGLLDGRNAEPTGVVEQVLGRPATSFAQWAARTAGERVWS